MDNIQTEDEQCQLLGGLTFHPSSCQRYCCAVVIGLIDYLAQFALLLVAIAGLWYKRSNSSFISLSNNVDDLFRIVEVPRRPIKIWGLDISKQAFSGLAGHLCNMVIAMIVSMDISQTSECSWYFVVFMIDTVFGVFLTLLLHKALLYTLRTYLHHGYTALPLDEGERHSKSWMEYVVHCGEYGDPPSFRIWAFQMTEWVFVTIISRSMCGCLIYTLRGFVLVDIAAAVDTLFIGHPHLLLFAVMVMCPVIMNLIQVWIQDNILKWKKAILLCRKRSIRAHRVTDIDDEVLDEES